jgi:hypothetical protein
MQDYRLDAVERPERQPAGVDWLTGRDLSAPVGYCGELPGRKIDGPLTLCPCNLLRRTAFMGQGLMARGDRAPAKHARSVRAGDGPS